MRCASRIVLVTVLLSGAAGELRAAEVMTRPVKAAAPTTATDLAGCASADCHAEVKQYAFVHGPVVQNTCDACHRLADPARHRFELIRQKVEMCTYCHEFSTGAMPVVHQPVRAGECLGCHNPHGGPAASMMREKTMAQLCARCHDSKTMQRKFMHKPVKDGDCGACHQPHASKYPKLVDAIGSDLCLYCHKDFKKQMAKVKFRHQALDKGCSDCHDVHGSDFPKDVTRSIPDLCLSCHDKIKTQAAEAMYKHPAVLGDRACMTCHTAHGGDLASLMSDLPVKVCMTCHDKAQKNGKGGVVPAVAEVMDPTTFKHGPIRDGQCGGCHNIHGGNQQMLLRKTNTDKFYEKFSTDNYALCFSCHDPLLARDDQKRVMTRFRNGDENLHTVHVGMPPKGRNCRVCHATHASKQAQDIRASVPFGKWQLPITFTKTPTGGSCDTGCHLTYAYDRVHPVPNPKASTRPTTRPTADHDAPVIARWIGKAIDGSEVAVPDAARPTLVLFLRAGQAQSEHVVKMVAAVSRPAQVVVVISGTDAAAHAAELGKAVKVPWPVVLDEDYSLSRQMGVEVWPATQVVLANATVLTYVAGAPLSLTTELEAYLDFAGGRIERQVLDQRLASFAVVADGPAQKATWHLQMARKLVLEGKPEQAMTMLNDGLRLQPDSLPLQVGLVDVLVALQQPRLASDALAKLPKDALPGWQMNLLWGKLAVAQRQPTEARRRLGLALKEKPDLPEAHFLMGQAYEQERNWEKAAMEYRAAGAPGLANW